MNERHQYPIVIQSIASIRTDLQTFADSSKIPASELRQITMIVEELFSKIVRFGPRGNGNQLLKISLIKNDAGINIEISDEGDPFNPLENTPEQLYDPASVDEGGMDLSLIKAFCDSIEYTREKNRNILYIQKYFREKPEKV